MENQKPYNFSRPDRGDRLGGVKLRRNFGATFVFRFYDMRNHNS